MIPPFPTKNVSIYFIDFSSISHIVFFHIADLLLILSWYSSYWKLLIKNKINTEHLIKLFPLDIVLIVRCACLSHIFIINFSLVYI